MVVTLDQIFQSASSALGLPEMVAMVLGGVLFGMFVLSLSQPVRSGDVATGYVVMIAVMTGLVFFVSRGSALFFDQSALWPRNIGFGVLWLIYCLSMWVGLDLRSRTA